MKKKLLIIGIVIGILLIGFVFLFPIYNNLTNNRLDNNPELNKIAHESYSKIIEKYQKAIDYPPNMVDVLELDVGLGDYCNHEMGTCDYYYAYYDLKEGGSDELIIRAVDNQAKGTLGYDGVIDIFYYEPGEGAQSISPGGFLNSDPYDVDYSEMKWTKLTKSSDFVVDAKYKVYDYLYIVEQDLFVKGKAVNEDYSSERIMKSDLKTLYPKLYNVADRIKYNMSRCVQASAQTNGQYKCEVDTSTYVYPMIYQYPAEGTSSKAGLTEYYFKTANIYYDTDDDGYVDQAGKGIFVAPIDQFNEKVGQLLSDGTIIQNDSKTNNSSNTTTGSNNTTTGSGNTNNSSNNTTTGSNNTGNNINTTTGSNNTDNTTNQNNVDDSQVDKPTKKYLYKLVFNNFDKYYKDNFGDTGYTNKSIITFYIDGECVTDTKVDDIELRPAGSYSIYSKELSGLVNFDLYIDNKKVDTISVNVDEKMQANWIYMD